MTTSVSQWPREPTSNQTPKPVLSYQSFSCPMSELLAPLLPLPHDGHLRAFRHGCHFHKEDNLRTHYLVGLSTILYHCTLFFFFTASLTMYNCVSAGLFYFHLCLPPICMRTGDLSISFSITVPAPRVMLGTQDAPEIFIKWINK